MQWISVKQQMPEPNTPVLVFDDRFPAWLQTSTRIWAESDEQSGYVWTGLEIHSVNLADPENYVFDDEYTVTHWMPLPAPPSS